MSDVTVLPSTTTGEAFGLVLLESLACATPVIASNLPGVRTVVNSNKDGYLICPNSIADLIEKLQMMVLLTQERRREMGQMGREKVKRTYSWEQIGEKLNAVYLKVL
jgi:glycosyltransferase involved in cell wall biosynthesis